MFYHDSTRIDDNWVGRVSQQRQWVSERIATSLRRGLQRAADFNEQKQKREQSETYHHPTNVAYVYVSVSINGGLTWLEAKKMETRKNRWAKKNKIYEHWRTAAAVKQKP